MTHPKQPLEGVLDVDLCGWLCYQGIQPLRSTLEAGRVVLWFPIEAVKKAREEIAAGRARPELRTWSATIRRLHADCFSASAKAALRASTESAHG